MLVVVYVNEQAIGWLHQSRASRSSSQSSWKLLARCLVASMAPSLAGQL